MKKKLLLGLVSLLLVGGATSYQLSQASEARRCTGSKNCRACKNCNYCKHCAKQGGKCGVCR